MNFFNFKKKSKTIKLSQSDTGEWMVKKGLSVLYIGSKEKCEFLVRQTQSA